MLVTFLLLSFLSFFLLISVLSILLWASLLEVLLLVVVLVMTLILVALWSLSISILVVLVVEWHLWNEDLWLLTIVEIKSLNLSGHSNWCWAQVLVWVEATEGSHLSEACDLDQGWRLRVQWTELEWADGW